MRSLSASLPIGVFQSDVNRHSLYIDERCQAALAISNARQFGSIRTSHTDLTQAYDATLEG